MNWIQKLGIPSVARVCVTQRNPGCQWELLGFSIARGEPLENVHSSSFKKLFLGPAGATEKGCLDILEDSWGLEGLESLETDHEHTVGPGLKSVGLLLCPWCLAQKCCCCS